MSHNSIQVAWIQGLCTAIPILTAARVTYLGIKAWGPQKRDTRRFELAEQCLSQAQTSERIIKQSRLISLGPKKEEAERVRNAAFEELNRFAESCSKLQVFTVAPLGQFTVELRSCLLDIESYATLLSWWELQDDVRPEERTQKAELRAKLIPTAGGADDLSKRIDTCIEGLRKSLQQHLFVNDDHKDRSVIRRIARCFGLTR